MKLVSLVLALGLSVSSLVAEPNWSHSYEEVKSLAQKESKAIMIMISKEGCDACWYMENIVFEDTKLKALVMNSFIPLYLDVNNDEIPSELHYIGTPTFYFMTAKGEKIGHRINGASNVKDFTQKVEGILETIKENTKP